MLTKEKILSRCVVDPKTGCWLWQGARNWQGYGKAKENGKHVWLHKKAFELWKGPIPEGLCVLHDCPERDNPSCCNPDHLWLGTKGDNNRDSVKKGQHRCVNRKLTPDQVKEILSDDRAQQSIARDYGVHQTQISAIKRRETYSYVNA